MQGSRSSHRKYKSLTHLFDILSLLKLLEGANDPLLHKSEQILRAVPRYGESGRTARHLVDRHLIEPLQEQHLELCEYFVEPRRNFGESL